MNRLKGTCYLICLALLLMFFGGLVGQPIALALSEAIVDSDSPMPAQAAPTDEEVELTCQYPKLTSSGYSGTAFTYDIEVRYKGGEEPRLFDLRADVPAGFNYSIRASYAEGTEIAAIRLDPTKTYADTIKVIVRSYLWLVPEPGEYDVTVEVSSGEIKDSIELTATVTASYDLELETSTGRLNAEATAGQDNYCSIVITNTGTADLKDIKFESKITGNPSGWSVTFNPDKIEFLQSGDSREVEINIKPAPKTISGDYMVTISSEPESEYAFGHIDIRVTVLTPTIWGWVGVGIVVLVVAGLAWMFMRFGRR